MNQNHYFTPAQAFLTPSAIVNEGTALGLPVLWRGLNIVANAVASMAPVQLFSGNEAIETPSVVSRPNPEMTTYDFWYQATATAILHGNYIGVITRDVTGQAVSVTPIHPQYASYVLENGRIRGWQIGTQTFSPDDILHIKGFSLPQQLKGVGIIEAHRRGLALAIDTLQYASSSFRGSGVPSVAIKFNGDEPSQEALDDFGDRWEKKYADASRPPAFLPPNVDVVSLGTFSPEKMESLASQTVRAADIASMLMLDPIDLGASYSAGGATEYANLQDRKAARYLDAVSPWVQRFSQAWNDLVPGDTECRFQVEKLLGFDEEKRNDINLKLLAANVITVNEFRQLLGKDPLPESSSDVVN